ncbi:ROK family transcriptional regulator [Phytomonospora endophytica]|uniref:Putative NBD/HSP70 family sugar kinase n=1 Tax=Phytomonospora endophytica TaxID=714109 RepID=A0A841FGT6_9ACTN|nr:ROK family transcriptional regulator [Phytomonospora endophytica]MBB6034895.1 putative NBD/HSP70 family sugar kinase [Phytomonospora endophytica]GIG70599.1 transcriptional regulator [Phytomonospora endophytica]
MPSDHVSTPSRARAEGANAARLWRDGLRGNTFRVARALREAGPSTRAELVSRTGLSRPTVSAALTELGEAGLAGEEPKAAAQATGGRRAALVSLSRSAGLAVGVDIGRRHVRVAVADLGQRILTECSEPLDRDADDRPAHVLDRTTSMVDGALAEVGAVRGDIVGVGLGIPVPLTRLGVLGSPTLLPAWADLVPASELSARLGVPVHADNDANLGALGEQRWGAGRGTKVFVYVKLATGVGAGLVFDGVLFRGITGTAGELGHITLDAHGPVCQCGNRGCLELYVGGRALLDHARHTHPTLSALSELTALAAEGDPRLRRILNDAGGHLGIALGGLVNLVNPELIAVGGELGAAAQLFLDPLRTGLTSTAMPAAAEAVHIAPAALGDRATALGGVALALSS